MTKRKDRYVFPAIFEYTDSGIGVTFPDLPGCVSVGENDADAYRMAKEALSLHLYGMEEDGDEIPKPTPVHKVEKEDPNEAVVFIDVWMPPFRDEMEKKPSKNRNRSSMAEQNGGN
ncbi:type II toxin-antitoxin system HicB family antitoxin [Melghirimyces algeriensis]|uniref:Predicted nuclease of the RNAse H fold, HicB family n=1 Tax=Melghirimyces algeriensis TaxID=910412 RepID=A0A521BXK9_9BACL|nr:type II toxin-antitoxin system HicB family antitoxin [Melghirimyces algeriensis]SMO51200.1 Predicted nuclease of the RNAse H fold, HicB family [Melghirimyces algeriensis]